MNGDAHGKPSGWTVTGHRSHYTIGYWLRFAVATLVQTVATPPRITYTLRNASSGETRRVVLPGDHSPADLEHEIARL